jgi:hypothetical protein
MTVKTYKNVTFYLNGSAAGIFDKKNGVVNFGPAQPRQAAPPAPAYKPPPAAKASPRPAAPPPPATLSASDIYALRAKQLADHVAGTTEPKAAAAPASLDALAAQVYSERRTGKLAASRGFLTRSDLEFS